MTQGLPISSLINVSVVLSPSAAAIPNLNTAIIIGDSDVINTVERYRNYATLAAVATDFGTTAQEYLAASLFFGQTPQPNQLYIGRWASGATKGKILGGVLTATQQTLATWTAITTPKLKIAIDGSAATVVTPASFAGAASLNAIAALIQTAIQAVASGGFTLATCVWTGSQFVITSGTTGALSAVSNTTAPGSGTDIGGMMLMNATQQQFLVPGLATETPLAAYTILDALNFYFYASMFASAVAVTDDQYVALAGYVEGANNKHVLGITSSEVGIITTGDTTNIAYRLQQAVYNRSFVQYSSANANAVASFIGRFVTVNFNGSLTAITMMYKQEPGVTGENLTATQAAAVASYNANVFVGYNNNTIIVQYGTVASGQFFDTIFNVDWLALAIQTNVFNLLYTSGTKVPQTDAGNNQIANAIESACVQAVANGVAAPGQWTGPAFGQLATNSYMPKGYYIYQPAIASQSTSDRNARKSVPFQVGVKLAGAVHTVNVILDVNQ